MEMGENMVAAITLVARALGAVTEIKLWMREISAVAQMAPMPRLSFIISLGKITRLPGLPALTRAYRAHEIARKKHQKITRRSENH